MKKLAIVLAACALSCSAPPPPPAVVDQSFVEIGAVPTPDECIFTVIDGIDRPGLMFATPLPCPESIEFIKKVYPKVAP